MRAAAAITSITMNGGTLLRADGSSSRRADEGVMAGSPKPRDGAAARACSRFAAFGMLLNGRSPGATRRDGARVDPAGGRH